MTVLETAITFQGKTLVEREFYDADDVLDHNIRNSLLQAISGLADEAFGDEIQNFTLGEHSIILITREIEEPINPDNKQNLQMYAIVEKDTDEKTVKKCMEDAMNQFLNRFSVNYIFQKKTRKFRKFPKRLDKIFQDLRLRTEDRFK